MKFFNTPFLSYVYDNSRSGYWNGTNVIHYMYVNIPRDISITVNNKVHTNNVKIDNKPMMPVRFFSNGFSFMRRREMMVIYNTPNPDVNTSHYHRNQQLIMDKYSEIVNHLYCK